MNTVQDKASQHATRVPKPAYRIDPFAAATVQDEKIIYQSPTASPRIVTDSIRYEMSKQDTQVVTPTRSMNAPIADKMIERAPLDTSRIRMDSMDDRIPRKEKTRMPREITPIANKKTKWGTVLDTRATETPFLDETENGAKVAREEKRFRKLKNLVKDLETALLEVWEDPSKIAHPSRKNIMKSVKQWTIGRVTWSGMGTEPYWQPNNITNIGSVFMRDPEDIRSKKSWQKEIYKKYYERIIREVAPEWAGEHRDFVVQTTMYGDNGYCKLHRDKHDVDCQYLIGFGDYVGGELEVDLPGGRKKIVDIRHKIVRMDGRLPHCVKPWIGNRQSVIWYKVWDRRYEAPAATRKKVKVVLDLSEDLA